MPIRQTKTYTNTFTLIHNILYWHARCSLCRVIIDVCMCIFKFEKRCLKSLFMWAVHNKLKISKSISKRISAKVDWDWDQSIIAKIDKKSKWFICLFVLLELLLVRLQLYHSLRLWMSVYCDVEYTFYLFRVFACLCLFRSALCTSIRLKQVIRERDRKKWEIIIVEKMVETLVYLPK